MVEDCLFKLKSVNMSSKKRKSSCLLASSKKAPQRKKSGKSFQNWADALAAKVPASNRRSCLHWARETFDISKHYFLDAFAVRSASEARRG